MIRKTSDTDNCINYLRQLGLLTTHQECCGKNMKSNVCPTKDGARWICTKCKRTKSIREDSIFKVI